MGNDGWDEHRKLVLHELERLSSYVIAVDRKVNHLIVDVSALKVQAGIWGAMAGMISTTIIVLGLMLKEHLK